MPRINWPTMWRTAAACGLVVVAAGLALAQESPTVAVPSTQPGVMVSAEEPKTRPASFDGAIIVPVKMAINEVTLDSIKRRFALARAEGRKLVVLELNTPGGALGPTLEICNEIKRIRDEGVTVYAWVNHQAYSAGTIIALATDGIVMATNATMGDCQPITLTESGIEAIPKEIEAKQLSPLLEELRDSIRRNGYNLNLVFSLIRPELQVFWVVNGDTGEKRFVNAVERNALFGIEPAKDAGSVEPVPDSTSTTAWRYVHEDSLLGKVEQPVEASHELLTMRDRRAQAFGFSQGTVSNDAQLRAFLNIRGTMERADLTWMEHVVDWLASPVVRAVLFMLMLLGAYAEFHAPGVSLPGAVALICLVLFLGAPYLTGFTVTWEIVVIVAGLVLLALELFVIPGFGIVGLAGFILLGFGLLSSFAPPEPLRRHWFDLPELPQTYNYLKQGVLVMGGGFTGALVGMAVLARYLPQAPLIGRMIGRNPTREDVVCEDPYFGLAKVGDIGRTESLLRPAGKARFGAMLVDVISQGEYIESGQKVEVIERSGNHVVVRRTS